LDLLGIDGKKYKAQDIKHSGLPISDDFGRLLGGFNQMLDQEQSLSLDMTAGFINRAWLADNWTFSNRKVSLSQQFINIIATERIERRKLKRIGEASWTVNTGVVSTESS
jgi:hypothetical protein